MRYTWRLIFVFVLLLPFGFKAFGQETKQEAKPDTAATATQEMKQEVKQEPAAKGATPEHSMGREKRFVATVGADGVQHVEITGGEYYLDPNYIVVKVNVPVELSVKKAADSSWFIPHDVLVQAPEAGIDFKTALKKEPQTIKFTPTKVGKYEMMCDKKPPFGKSHKDRGMDGFIEVVP